MTIQLEDNFVEQILEFEKNYKENNACRIQAVSLLSQITNEIKKQKINYDEYAEELANSIN